MTQEDLELIASVAHEIQRQYCLSIDDYSLSAWDQAPEWQKETVIDGVKFHIENPEASPANSHENWLKKKLADGWTYGEVKDPVAKTHPCIKDYGELPQAQRSKDFLFRAVVHALTEHFDFS